MDSVQRLGDGRSATHLLDHVSLVATLSARPGLHVLEALQLEELAGFRVRHLLFDGLVGVQLRIGGPDHGRALGHRSERLHGDVPVLEVGTSSLAKGVGHDHFDGRLRSEGPTVGVLLGGQSHAGVPCLLLLELQVV